VPEEKKQQWKYYNEAPPAATKVAIAKKQRKRKSKGRQEQDESKGRQEQERFTVVP
jgi:hypothetical protein